MSPSSSYYGISDGYLVYTQLDSSFTYPGNPFREQRLAKVHPVNGDTWKQLIGSPDTLYYVATFIGDMSVSLGSFKNVFAFTEKYVKNGFPQSDITNYVAPDVGVIAGEIDNQSYIWTSYIKVNGIEYGALLPDRDPQAMRGRTRKNIVPFWLMNERRLTGRSPTSF